VAEEPQLLGSAGTLAENHDFVAGENTFYVLYADVLTNVDLQEMRKFHQQHRLPVTLGICQVPDPTRCGIVTVDKNAIIRDFVEKPKQPVTNWAFSGVMIAGPELLHCFPNQQRPADIGFDLLPKMVGRMAAYRITKYLLDIGTMPNYQAAQQSWPGLLCGRQSAHHQ
ncbi:MAG TPA: sugar phosphate nucleotidyltransferase, partial [Candidatus Angelobacter sp.]